MRGRRWLVVLVLLGTARSAEADEPSRPPLPESLLTESATDIDAEDEGELEAEANVGAVGARRGGAHAQFTSLEAEWRAFKELGLRIEPSYARVVDAGAAAGRDDFGLSGAVAVGLFHDPPHDTHLQLELLGRTPDTGSARVFEPGDTQLPLAADLVGALRRGAWTVRATVGGEAGGPFAHAPVHTDFAVLTGLAGEDRFGFFGFEARLDWAREAPLVLAPDIVADASPIGIPLRLGVALPFNVGAGATAASFGVFVRLMLITGREVALGRRPEEPAPHVSGEPL